MSLVKYAPPGRTGLRVRPFCLGAMTSGEDLGWGTAVKESEQILDHYVALGGNFIDTENAYAGRTRIEPSATTWVGTGQARPPEIATNFSASLYPHIRTPAEAAREIYRLLRIETVRYEQLSVTHSRARRATHKGES